MQQRQASKPGIVHKKTLAKTQGNYPAAEKIIQVVRQGLEHGSASGYEAEAKAFGELVMTPESAALRSLFFASTSLKKEAGGAAKPHALHHIGVLGGGLMGGAAAPLSTMVSTRVFQTPHSPHCPAHLGQVAAFGKGKCHV